MVSIISRCGLIIEAHHRNQPNKNKLGVYNPVVSFESYLKQLYISNKTECCSYKGGCGICGHPHIKALKKEKLA